MNFALKQENLNNRNSTCIGCGVCETVSPMDVLGFGNEPYQNLVQIEQET